MAFEGPNAATAVGAAWFTSATLVFVSSFLLTCYILRRHAAARAGHTEEGKGLQYPPSIGSLPLIGSIPYLPRRMDDLHKFCLEKTYSLGGVFSMNVGNKLVVFLTTHGAIREAFVKNSAEFSNRPTHFFDSIGNPNAKGIAARKYDSDFKKFQKLSLAALKEFGFGQNIMESRISQEVLELVEKIKQTKGQPFDPRDMMFCALENVIAGVLFGQRINDEKNSTKKIFALLLKAADKALALLPLDILPLLRFMPHFSRLLMDMQNIVSESNNLIDSKIDELLCSGKTDNFVNFYVTQEGSEFDKEQLRLTLGDLLIGGSDTSSNTMLWALVLLANNPHVQERLQKDIDNVIPRDRLPSLADKAKLPYVEAAILELLRRKPLLQYGLPHMTSCDTDVGGYFIPKNTQVISVIYAVHMNADVWENPEEFRPERFLDDAGNVINQDTMITFSVGKRSCLGEVLARQEIFLFFTAILQQFYIRPPEGGSLVDCHEETKSMLMPSPFRICLLPRD